jgi:hypothetical protein
MATTTNATSIKRAERQKLRAIAKSRYKPGDPDVNLRP